MPDFTSALYLGWKHPSHQIPDYDQLTTGKPSLLQEPILAKRVAQKLANLQGLEHGILGRSTLHLFWDLFEILGKQNAHIFYDELLYEVPKWSLRQLKLHGNPVQKIPHFKTTFLKSLIQRSHLKNRKPVIVTDGFCPQCGLVAPLKSYLNFLRPFNGILVIDDTQAFGFLGKQNNLKMPIGFGGGGVLPFKNLKSKNIISISSLAKSFGVPVAVLTGSFENVNYFIKNSQTRIHCSPPTFAEINTLQKTLTINKLNGNSIRFSLIKKIKYFKNKLEKLDLKLNNSCFPVQMILGIPLSTSIKIFNYLKSKKIHCLLLKSHLQNQAALSFIINNEHSKNDLDYCLKAIQKVLFKYQKINNHDHSRRNINQRIFH